MHLQGKVPVIRPATAEQDFPPAASDFAGQLTDWGFMALEVPGIGAEVADLGKAFATACAAAEPRMSDYSYQQVPQRATGGNHGFFQFHSEVPRLSGGVPDPKEFLHVSGAMLDDVPSGSGALLAAFPELGGQARAVFEKTYRLAVLFGDLVRGLLPGDPPELGLDPHSTILRLIHYWVTDGREVLAHEHSGIQMLGLQLPPSDQGLQYVLHDGTWVEPVLAGTDVVLCNIGRMLTEASGDRYRPSTHRVHNSAPREGAYERWSSVLFIHPDHEARQWRVGPDGVTVSDRTWGDFVRDRVSGLGIDP
jgi:hypothetical protein